MGVCWDGMDLCGACESSPPKPLSGSFLRGLRDKLVQYDTTVVEQGPDGKGRVIHRGAVDRLPPCNVKSRRAEMCDTLALYCYKNG
jgi:hypothetical protein